MNKIINISAYFGIHSNIHSKYYTAEAMKIKQTALKKLAFLGAAICEGQLKKGVAKGPKLIR